MKRTDFSRMSSKGHSLRSSFFHALKIIYILAQTGLFAWIWMAYYLQEAFHPYYYWGNWTIIGIYCCLCTMMTRLYGGFRITTSRHGELLYSQAIGSVLTDGIIYCIFCLLAFRPVNPTMLLLRWVLGFIVSAIWVYLAIAFHDRLCPPYRTYIIYDNKDALNTAQALNNLTWKFRILDCLDISRGLPEILHLVGQAEAVVLCGLHSTDRNTILKFCIAKNIHVYTRPKIGDILLSSASRIHMETLPFLFCTSNSGSFWYRTAKRSMDIILSACALVLFSPVLLIVALAVKLEDGGPVLYRQLRLTEGGREFYILKFRSMQVDAEKDGIARLSTEHDDRITKTGQLIRKCRLDELPQLFNILRGEMSIVGPRPERPEIAVQYEESIPEFRLRLQVKAGLTGYAQVYGRYNTDPYDKLEMDLMYIAKLSILQDITLIFATIKILFLTQSTKGVAQDQTTASDKTHISV